MKNALTKTEAQVIQHVHHGLMALSTEDAAKNLGMRPDTVRYHLRNAEKKAPELFPILTSTQAKILHAYTVEGCTVAQIAIMRDISEGTVREHLRKLRDKGVLSDGKLQRPVRFEEWMSDKVSHKW